jgi:hypothetical protein
MIFHREACEPLESPSIDTVAFELSCVKSSFADLTKPDGSYLQVAGGPGLFLLEYHDSSGQHHRGSQEVSQVPFPNGTILQFSGGNIAMNANEWFLRDQVVEVFSAFIEQRQWPSFIHWGSLRADFTRDG